MRRKDWPTMGKTVEYRTLETSLNDLEAVLNEYAHERFKPIQFLPTEETGSVMVVFSRKLKHKKPGKPGHDTDDYEVHED